MKKLLLLLSVILIVGVIAGCSKKEDASKSATESKETVVRVGVVGENVEQWGPVTTNMAKEGVKIVLVKFSDYSQPNQALANKEIELNAFQHYAFLNNDIKMKKYELTVVGESIIAPLAIYSKKIKALSELKKDDKVAIPSDPTNGGRSLKLLESAGLIKVKPEAGYLPVVGDITENSLNLQIIQIEAAQTPRLLDDVAISVINGGHAVDAGFSPLTDSLFIEKIGEGSENPYVNVIVARTEEKDNPVYKRIVEAFHTDEVAEVIKKAYRGSYLPAWKK